MGGAGRSIGQRVVWGLALVSTGDGAESVKTYKTHYIDTFSNFRSHGFGWNSMKSLPRTPDIQYPSILMVL